MLVLAATIFFLGLYIHFQMAMHILVNSMYCKIVSIGYHFIPAEHVLETKFSFINSTDLTIFQMVLTLASFFYYFYYRWYGRKKETTVDPCNQSHHWLPSVQSGEGSSKS